MICEKCNVEMLKYDLETQYVFYCPKCHIKSEIFDICEHKEYKKVIFIVADGSERIGEICTSCFKKTNKNYKKADCVGIKMPKKTLEDYYKYFENIDNKNYTKLNELNNLLFGNKSKEWWVGYTDYMKSVDWNEKRTRILKRDGHKCQICGENADQVHHLCYVHKPKEYDFELVSLCTTCHFDHYHPERKVKK